MTTDVRTLLHDAADMPTRAPDLERAQRLARDRRRRGRGLSALVAVVVLALVTGAIALGTGGGDDARVAIGPRDNTSTIPDGWQTVQSSAGLTISIPPEWNQFDFGRTDVAATLIAVATSAPPNNVVSACRSDGTVPTQSGTWLNLWEYADPAAFKIAEPPGDVMTPAGTLTGEFRERPAKFEAQDVATRRCGSSTESLGAAVVTFPFRDQGRLFLARVVTTYPVGSTADFTTADRILDTLRVEPLDGATTTTLVIPSPPPPTVTTLPPFVPTTDDEHQIRDLFVNWLRKQSDDEIRQTFEDADGILDTIHAGMAQHSDEDLAKYSGTVSAVRMLDSDHAEVDYTLLFAGQPEFGLRTGVAVRIDGQWRVSRATECSLLSLGGLTCPPAP